MTTKRQVLCDACERPIAAGAPAFMLYVERGTVTEDHRHYTADADAELDLCGACFNDTVTRLGPARAGGVEVPISASFETHARARKRRPLLPLDDRKGDDL